MRLYLESPLNRIWTPVAEVEKWGSANTTTLFQAPIRGLKAGIIV